jgi:hypothetical protein
MNRRPLAARRFACFLPIANSQFTAILQCCHSISSSVHVKRHPTTDVPSLQCIAVTRSVFMVPSRRSTKNLKLRCVDNGGGGMGERDIEIWHLPPRRRHSGILRPHFAFGSHSGFPRVQLQRVSRQPFEDERS